MAIIICPKCNKRFSDNMPECPHCVKTKKQLSNNKTFLSVIIILLLLGVIVVGLMNFKATKDNSIIAQVEKIEKQVEKSKAIFNQTAETEARIIRNKLAYYFSDHVTFPSRLDLLDQSDIPDTIVFSYKMLDNGNNYFAGVKHVLGDKWYTTTSSEIDITETSTLSIPTDKISQKPKTALPSFNTNGYCDRVSDAVGGSYAIKEQCLKDEHSAMTRLEMQTVTSKTMNYCTNVSSAVGGSYQILETCIEQEDLAKSRITNY